MLAGFPLTDEEFELRLIISQEGCSLVYLLDNIDH
jgi:hypothetical protein